MRIGSSLLGRILRTFGSIRHSLIMLELKRKYLSKVKGKSPRPPSGSLLRACFQYVPIGRSTIKCLWNYIKKRAVIDVNTDSYLFLARRGTPLSARGIQIVFRNLKKKLNLDGHKLSPHLLRHSFALAYIENGGDPFSLQRILGHTDQTTTAKYVNMARSNVKAQHSKYSPGERLG